MKVINYASGMITISDTNENRVKHGDQGGIEELFTKEEFKEMTGIVFDGYITVIYEPDRQLFYAHKEGERDGVMYDKPDEHPIIKKIDGLKTKIFDGITLKFMEKEKPSPFHVIKNFRYILPRAYTQDYKKYKDQKEGWKYIQKTQRIADLFLEFGEESKETKVIMKKRKEAYAIMDDDFIFDKLNLV